MINTDNEKYAFRKLFDMEPSVKMIEPKSIRNMDYLLKLHEILEDDEPIIFFVDSKKLLENYFSRVITLISRINHFNSKNKVVVLRCKHRDPSKGIDDITSQYKTVEKENLAFFINEGWNYVWNTEKGTKINRYLFFKTEN